MSERKSVDALLQELVGLERAALDRWIKLDPSGYLARDTPDVTYFDPTTDKRVDGFDALQARFAPISKLTLPWSNPRYDMIEPRVQRYGDTAVLTFNLLSYGTFPGQSENLVARWNATEVYVRTDGTWRIVHSHWSYTQPNLK